jgi:hypothetical protein
MAPEDVLDQIADMQRHPTGRTLDHSSLLKVLELVELHRGLDLLQRAVETLEGVYE